MTVAAVAAAVVVVGSRRAVARGLSALGGARPLVRKEGKGEWLVWWYLLSLSLSLSQVLASFAGEGDIQSWTSRETLGLADRLFIFLLAGLVVMTMTGAREKGDDGR